MYIIGKMTWNTPKLRQFDLLNYNISIEPSYSGKDIFGFKAGSKHYSTTSKIGFTNGRIAKKVK
jgi:hypothetical protein